MKFTTITVLLLTLALAGCAALAGYEQQKKQQQEERVLYKTLL